MLTAGGIVGSSLGVLLFGWLQRQGQIDIVITLLYVLLLGTVGGLMFAESFGSLIRSAARPAARRAKLHQHHWLHGLPLKIRFTESRLYISALLPLTVGAAVGVLTAIMGVGGGFIMLPAMIYLIGMPTQVVIGTSLFQIAFVTAVTTFLHAYNNKTVDMVLALALIVGAVVSTQFGSRAGTKPGPSIGHGLRAVPPRVAPAGRSPARRPPRIGTGTPRRRAIGRSGRGRPRRTPGTRRPRA